MSYDPVTWRAQEIGRQPRRRRTRWPMVAAMVMVVTIAAVEAVAPSEREQWEDA